MADSQQSATLLTKLLSVSDHTMAMHQWMLFSAALRRRPEYRCLLADPRLRPATVAQSLPATSYDYHKGFSALADELPIGLEAQQRLDKEWSAARSAALSSPPSELKRKPPPKKSKEKMPTKKKKTKKVSACVGLSLECCCRCRRTTSSPPSRRLTRTGRPRCSPSSLPPRTELIVCRTGCR
jgi:hypothetical protein